MKTYRYTDEKLDVVSVFDEDGVSRTSILASEIPEGIEVDPPTPISASQAALETILMLETAAQVNSQRLFREAVLAMIEKEALTKGIPLELLALKNKGYRELKQFDAQIAELRDQL